MSAGGGGRAGVEGLQDEVKQKEKPRGDKQDLKLCQYLPTWGKWERLWFAVEAMAVL